VWFVVGLIVRIIFVVLLLAKGGGGLLYILLWIFVPSADAKKSTSKE
jgi:phage shock protein PspC (stress-responsive transcriptional regulator)